MINSYSSSNHRHTLYSILLGLFIISVYISLSISNNFVFVKYMPIDIFLSQNGNTSAINSSKFHLHYLDGIVQQTFSRKGFDNLLQKINNLFPLDYSYLFSEEQSSKLSFDYRRKGRMELLHKFCESEEYRNRELTNYIETTDRLDVSLIKDFKAFECRTPKTGTTTRGAITWGLFHEGPVGKKHPHGDKKIPSMRIQDFLIKRQKTSDFDNWFGFQFVRDPFDRAISAYFDKVTGGNRLTGRNTSLTSFFEQLVAGNVANDPHFLPQLAICDPCQLKTSFYGRTETLSADMDYVINDATEMHRTLNYTSQSSVGSKFLNNKTDDSRLRNMALEPHVLHQFIWKYRHDFLAYGYNPHEAIKKAETLTSFRLFARN